MRPFATLALGLAALLPLAAPACRGSAAGARTLFATSVVPGRATRAILTPGELAAPLDFVVSFAMPHFAELEDRIQRGQTVSPSELEATYLPSASEYERVTDWLRNQGMAITRKDPAHTNIFARGSVSSVARVFDVAFGRVADAGSEFTSAIGIPSLPAELAGSVLGLNGLQPHLRAHHRQHGAAFAGGFGAAAGAPAPADIARAYSFPSSLSGAGQTIAIIVDAVPAASDLIQFWNTCGIPQSLANYRVVAVEGGPSPDGDVGEATLDVEWASSLAPGAAVRLYVVPDIQYASLLAAVTQILADLPNCPGLSQVSISFGGPEPGAGGAAAMLSYSQVYAQLAANGVTIFASSGDGGSNPGVSAHAISYAAANSAAVEYPASDPNITAVGGTTLAFDSGGTAAAESAWFSVTAAAGGAAVASGGGYSVNFPRPVWQTGLGISPGYARCVPDVAAQANAGYLVLGGQAGTCWGTSLSTPIWAAACAVINQSRVQQGLPTVGLIGPLLYPLLATNSFRDITAGGNGAYSAGPGYDLCTGLGTPNVANLIAVLSATIAPSLTLQPSSQTVAGGRTAVFNASATGVPAPSYQWTLNGAPVSGANDAILEVPNATPANAGVYACIVNNPAGTTTTRGATLAVGPASAPGRLVNISTRAWVGVGTSAVVGGFEIGGPGAETVLVRAVGPGLTTTFQLANTLAQPVLTLYSGSAPVATNAVWGNDVTIAQVANTVGAFPLQPASQDSALLVTLPPGGYTAMVTGAGNTTGLVLIEVYEVY